jgi:ParB family chromosome partitioning protein
MRLLDLPGAVQNAVMDGRLTMGHARALIGVEDAEGLARLIVHKGLSVREVEKLAQKAKGRAPKQSASRAPDVRDADISALEHHLADILGVKVQIGHRPDGGGMLSLQYSTLDQLDMLCQRLSGEPI